VPCPVEAAIDIKRHATCSQMRVQKATPSLSQGPLVGELGAEEPTLPERDRALVELGRALQAASYHFVTVTPETHRTVLTRDLRTARDLRDVFGWSRSFAPDVLPASLWALARAASVLEEDGPGLFKANVRFSSLGELLLVHSAFPTLRPDSVFFGPDTYRFCAFVERYASPAARVVDIGCGTGAGGLVAARVAERVVLSDINCAALRLARVNAALAGTAVEVVESDVLAAVSGSVDLVIANPPYMRDSAKRAYRDGGGAWGEALSLRILRESLGRLSSGGRLLLYTGAPVVAGRDVLRGPLEALCREAGASFSYEELDPDVFGEQLREPFYEDVERIAAVGVQAVLP
jgi:SAM-dependent methyltransferase